MRTHAAHNCNITFERLESGRLRACSARLPGYRVPSSVRAVDPDGGAPKHFFKNFFYSNHVKLKGAHERERERSVQFVKDTKKKICLLLC